MSNQSEAEDAAAPARMELTRRSKRCFFRVPKPQKNAHDVNEAKIASDDKLLYHMPTPAHAQAQAHTPAHACAQAHAHLHAASPLVDRREWAAFCCGSHLILLIFSSISRLLR